MAWYWAKRATAAVVLREKKFLAIQVPQFISLSYVAMGVWSSKDKSTLSESCS